MDNKEQEQEQELIKNISESLNDLDAYAAYKIIASLPDDISVLVLKKQEELINNTLESLKDLDADAASKKIASLPDGIRVGIRVRELKDQAQNILKSLKDLDADAASKKIASLSDDIRSRVIVGYIGEEKISSPLSNPLHLELVKDNLSAIAKMDKDNLSANAKDNRLNGKVLGLIMSNNPSLYAKGVAENLENNFLEKLPQISRKAIKSIQVIDLNPYDATDKKILSSLSKNKDVQSCIQDLRSEPASFVRFLGRVKSEGVKEPAKLLREVLIKSGVDKTSATVISKHAELSTYDNKTQKMKTGDIKFNDPNIIKTLPKSLQKSKLSQKRPSFLSKMLKVRKEFYNKVSGSNSSKRVKRANNTNSSSRGLRK